MLGIALAVTVLAILISVPLGIFMAKVASPWLRALLAVSITLPLWAGYLVKVPAMRITFTEQGFANWLLAPFGLSGPGFSVLTVVLTLTYLWLPYMAVPVYTAIRQVPPNLFDASADLGAGSWRTIASVVLPIKPALIAGSRLHVLPEPRGLSGRPVRRRRHPDDRQRDRIEHQPEPPLAAAYSSWYPSRSSSSTW